MVFEFRNLRVKRMNDFPACALFAGCQQVPFALPDAVEGRLHPVVLALRDGVVLVVVTASAVDGQTEKGLGDRPDHLLHLVLANHLALHGHARHESDGIGRSGHQKTGGDETVAGDRGQHVAGDLFPREIQVRLVPVEALDDVVPIGPGVFPERVPLEPLALGEPHHVEPMASPALPVAGGGEQPVDQLLVSCRRGVVHEGRDLLEVGRQADEIVADAANERPGVGRGIRLQTRFLHPRVNETVDGRGLPVFGSRLGRWWR